MPTNLIRQSFPDKPAVEAPLQKSAATPASGARIARLTAGGVSLRLRLFDTRTAGLIWSAMPLHSVAETWGDCLHFDTPLRTGRERGARLNVAAGDVCFWSEDERVVIAWGETPISRRGEIRLMRPCNIWAVMLDDPSALAVVTPGEKVALERDRSCAPAPL